MNQHGKFITIGFMAAVMFLSGRSVFAQTENKPLVEPNYEAMLYVILGSDDSAQSGELPKNLTAVSQQIRDNFAFHNIKLVNTYLSRIGNTGSIEYKSVSNIYGTEQAADSPSFLDWQLTGFRAAKDDGGNIALQMQTFRFGARVPIKFTNAGSESGKSPVMISYESVGLTLNRIGISENSPTLIGTISLPKTTGTFFLVLSIKPASDNRIGLTGLRN